MAAAGVLRFVTFNVARLERPDEVARVLRRLRPSFACLNEVSLRRRPSALADLAARLSEAGGDGDGDDGDTRVTYDVEFFGHAFGGQYGNALLSRHGPARARRDVHLDGGTRIVVPAAGESGGVGGTTTTVKRIQRGLMVCDFDVPHVGPVTVAATHLDHMRSAERRTQLAHVARELAPRGSDCVLLGDLNALTRGDYTDAEWRALEEHNAMQTDWEPPSGGDLAALADAGFADCFVAAHGDGARRRRRGVFSWTAHVARPRYRIDYAFARSSGGTAFALLDAHVDRGAGTAEASDHFPVVVDFATTSTRLMKAAL